MEERVDVVCCEMADVRTASVHALKSRTSCGIVPVDPLRM